MKIPVHTPPWPTEFVADGTVACMFCQQTDLPVLTRGTDLEALGETSGITNPVANDPRVNDPRVNDPRVNDPRVNDPRVGGPRVSDPKPEESVKRRVGVCESCAVHVIWTWRTNSGEAQPVFTDASVKQVSRVKVVLTRLRTKPTGEKMDPALVNSYDFAMLSDEGAIDLPGDDLAEGEPESKAAFRALEKLRVFTWPAFIEPLYKAYTPRGKLVSIVFISAWGMSSGEFDKSHWRAWPPEQWVVPGMKGFYTGFENAWALRLFKRQSSSQQTDEISVYVREGAVRYIKLQQQLRTGQPPEDLSMKEYLRQSMSSDEKHIEARLRKLAELAMSMKEERSEGVANMGDAGNQGLVRSQPDVSSPKGGGVRPENSQSEGSPPDDDENGNDETGEDEGVPEVAGSDVPLAGPAAAAKRIIDPRVIDPRVIDPTAPGAEESGDGEDTNEWPADLPFRPGEQIIEGDFRETPAASPEPGFVRVGRDLTTEPSKKSG